MSTLAHPNNATQYSIILWRWIDSFIVSFYHTFVLSIAILFATVFLCNPEIGLSSVCNWFFIFASFILMHKLTGGVAQCFPWIHLFGLDVVRSLCNCNLCTDIFWYATFHSLKIERLEVWTWRSLTEEGEKKQEKYNFWLDKVVQFLMFIHYKNASKSKSRRYNEDLTNWMNASR